MALLGEEGFSRLAALSHERAVMTADRLAKVKGVDLVTPTFFNEFTVKLAKPAAEIVEKLARENVLGGVPASRLMPHDRAMANLLVVAATELTTPADIEAFAAALAKVLV